MGSRRVRVSQRGGDWLGEIIMASHSGLGIGKRGGRRVGGTGHVGAHGGVAHRVAPVDEPLLPRGVEPLQPRLHLRHFPRPLGRAREAGARVLGDVGPTRAIENLRAQTGRVKIGTIFVSFAQVFGGLADGAFGRILSSLKPRLLTCTVAGLAYGVLLAWLAAGAAGYDGDSLPLSLVLMFMLGFPVSLPLCAFSGYFIALSVPLLWMGFGAAVCFAGASGRAYRLGTRLLVVHYIGVLIGMLSGTEKPTEEMLLGGQLQFAMLFGAVCALPTLFALWFAPALVVFEDAGAATALGTSFRAAIANWRPVVMGG